MGVALALLISELRMMTNVKVSMVDEEQEERIEFLLEQTPSLFPALQEDVLADEALLSVTLAPRCQLGLSGLKETERAIDLMVDAEIERRVRAKTEMERREREEKEAEQTLKANLEYDRISQEFQQSIRMLQFPKDWFFSSFLLFRFIPLIHLLSVRQQSLCIIVCQRDGRWGWEP